MDFTRINCISEKCKDKNIHMEGAGGSFGGRISYGKVRCPECGLLLLILPMSTKYEYGITATTEDERRQEQLQKAKEKSDLELAREIARINDSFKHL